MRPDSVREIAHQFPIEPSVNFDFIALAQISDSLPAVDSLVGWYVPIGIRPERPDDLSKGT